MISRVLTYAEEAAQQYEQRIALRGVAEQIAESLTAAKIARDRLSAEHRRHPLPGGATDMDLDLIGVQKTLERLRRELGNMARGKEVSRAG